MKLNLGSGRHPLPGFLSVDLGEADRIVDLTLMPWPWEDATVSEIMASHVLEHFTKEGGLAFLLECSRILHPGGRLHLAVPDMDRFIFANQTGDWSPLDGYHWTDLNDLLGGGAAEPEVAQRHRYMYCFASLAWTLQVAGFNKIQQRAAGPLDNPRWHAISLYVDAVL